MKMIFKKVDWPLVISKISFNPSDFSEVVDQGIQVGFRKLRLKHPLY